VVTCPGRFMRGRHAYAMLKMMGIEETIAHGINEYGAIAVRLATDSNYFNEIKLLFAKQRHKLYHDQDCIVELERHYRRWAKANSIQKATPAKESEYWFRKANGLLKNGSPHDAIVAYEKVVALRPDWDAAHYNLAVAFRATEQLSDAIRCARETIHINPAYRNAYPLLFRLAQHVCDWPLADEMAAHLDEITRQELSDGYKTTEPPLTNIRRTADLQTNLSVARSWSRHHTQAQPCRAHPVSFQYLNRNPDPMRIGYLSGDFKDHAVAYQIRGLLERHDRDRFEIYGYACNPDNGSPYRRKLVSGCDHFMDVHQWSNDAVAKQIHEDKIQILVDLSGHSKDNRLGIAAERPAPVQVSYLGFLGTTGADFIDYVLADQVVIPDEHRAFYSEKIVYLPHYQTNDDGLSMPENKPDRRKWGLPPSAFVFCSFNQPYKIDAQLFKSWMAILKRVDNSVLWLVERDAHAVENLRHAAEKINVDPSRLIFTGFVPMDENLSRLQLADLALDTVKYNGGATTANALWSGVPVVTVLGNHWVSRMSASALQCMGLPELIAKDLGDYEQLAVALASNPDRLTSIRHRLQRLRSTSPLFNTTAFARRVESAYAAMWERHNQGLTPETFHVAL
jgi:protein O-GlcNAc transferase